MKEAQLKQEGLGWRKLSPSDFSSPLSRRQSQKWLCLYCYWIPNGEVNENVLGRGKDCGVHLTKPQNTITMRFDRYRVEIIKPGGYTKIKSKLFG